MFVVISYDVTLDQRRTKVLKTLKNYGNRVQYSVFECEVSPDVFKRMREQVLKHIAPKEDSIRFYHLDEDMIARIESVGIGQVQRVQPVYFIGAPDDLDADAESVPPAATSPSARPRRGRS